MTTPKPKFEAGVSRVRVDAIGTVAGFDGLVSHHVRGAFWLVMDGIGDEWLRHESELKKLKGDGDDHHGF